MLLPTLILAIAALAVGQRDHDPVRKLAMGYQRDNRRIFGAELSITSVQSETRPEDDGGGYLLHVDYSISYTGRRKPFVIYPPSFSESDNYATRLTAYISGGPQGARECAVTSGQFPMVGPQFARQLAEDKFLVSVGDKPVTGRLSAVYAPREHPDRLRRDGARFRTEDYRSGEAIYLQLLYRPTERGGPIDAWVTHNDVGVYPLVSNVVQHLVGK